jgi:cell division protein FtsQ
MELSLPLPRRGTLRRGKSASGGASVRRRRALAWLFGNRLALRSTVAVLVVLPLLGGAWLWLRDSSLVAVRHVHITGVHGTDAIEIRTALDDAATHMTTLDFNEDALHAAVSSFAIVGALHVDTSFPHSVSISVTERLPVAALQSAGQRTAVAADGTVLGPAWLSSSLPLVRASVEPPAGARLREASALAAVTVLGAAPAPIARFVARAYNGSEGLTVAMRNGLLVYFGDATRPHAKWMSLARVLVSPSAAGALYVDVRLPERPAAGFSALSSSPSASSSSGSSASGAASTAGATSASGASSASSTASSSTPLQTGASDPTAAALAARLSEAAGGESTATSTAAAGAGESETSSSSPTESDSGSSESESAHDESEPTQEGSTSTGG